MLLCLYDQFLSKDKKDIGNEANFIVFQQFFYHQGQDHHLNKVHAMLSPFQKGKYVRVWWSSVNGHKRYGVTNANVQKLLIKSYED